MSPRAWSVARRAGVALVVGLYLSGCGSGDSGEGDNSTGSVVGAGGGEGISDVPCSSDGECAQPFPYCGPEIGRCVECLGDANCGDGDVCNPVSHACVDCSSDAQCGGENPYCDSGRGECVECLADTNCGAGRACDTTTGECRDACISSGDCGLDGRPYCDEARAVCVECLGDGNCGGDQPYCDVAEGRCVECMTDMNCAGTDNPLCQLGRLECVECLNDTDCGAGSECVDFECN